jgi:signal transduction histidine kinase
MSKDLPAPTSELNAAFLQYEKPVRIQNYKVACILALVFMPAGLFLDWLVYPKKVPEFLLLRLLCSLLLFGIWWLVQTPLGAKCYRVLGQTVAALPSVFISIMIYQTEGETSPYYAGMNLVLVGAAIILRWSLLDSLLVVIVTLTTYSLACYFHYQSNPPSPIGSLSPMLPVEGPKEFFSNFYFLFVTGFFVVIGSHFYNRIRFREFSLRFELDANKQQLEESNQKLKELDEIKGRFFANISHELRTPLTLMISPLETILSRHAAALGPATTSLLQTMHGNGLRLLKLINDLLDLVRLDSGVLVARRDPVALDEFLHNMASAARQVAEDKKIDLVVTVAPDVGVAMLDRDKLEKIVLNLQFNALKFTPSGGRVELRADKEGEELVLRVSDTGIGIPEKEMHKVFGRFFQVDSSAQRKYQGVGIGLALVKELVELHEGTVKVESVEGKGTTFTARMPFLAPAPGAVAAPVEKFEALPAAGAAAAAPSPSLPNASSNGAAPEPAASTGGTVSSQEWLSNLYHRANLFGAPAVDKSAAANGKVVQPVSSGHAATVLIADDQPDMLAFLKSELISQYNVIPVTDGQQAVDNAAAHLPDIILLDMMMPEKDGMQACREIRAAEATRSTPIILITAHVDEDTKLNALRAGASDFLPKPFSTTELQVRVQNLVKLYKSQRKLSEQNQTLEHTIDQLKETESQLVQTEKIVALGRLSAGIIHEINNPLNFAATALYTLRSKAKLIPEESRDDYAEVLKDVEEGIHRVKSIVSDLRTFTHPGARGVEEVNVQEAVSSALRFLSQEWKNKVEVKIDLPDAQVIWADRNKIIQVLINLLQNSLDAMQSKQFTDAKPSILISGRIGSGSSVLVVRDNGTGIAPEVMGKIFDPFFTTKDVGQGMGLGLSICYRIVQDFGGRIGATSQPGAFCEFTLEFPLQKPQSALQP